MVVVSGWMDWEMLEIFPHLGESMILMSTKHIRDTLTQFRLSGFKTEQEPCRLLELICLELAE